MPVLSSKYGHLSFGMGREKGKKERMIKNQMDD
jgi:hypothetical protein